MKPLELEKNNDSTLLTYTAENALIHTVVYAILFWYLPGITEGWRYLHYYALFGLAAFGAQPLIGILTDFVGNLHVLTQTGVMLVGIGFHMPTHFQTEYVTVETALTLRVVILGLGLALFRVSAGGAVLRRDEGKAYPIGVFLSSSALGVALAVFLPKLGYYLFPPLMLLAAISDPCAEWAKKLPPKKEKTSPVLAFTLILLAMAALFLRSFTETKAEILLPTDKKAVVLIALAILAGRVLSGFLKDWFGLLPTLVTLPISLFLLWKAESTKGLLLGLLLLNVTLPLLYYAVSSLLPRAPGMAFGLCSCVLFPAAWIAERGGLLLSESKKLIVIGAALALLTLIAYAVIAKDFRFLGKKKKGGKVK